MKSSPGPLDKRSMAPSGYSERSVASSVYHSEKIHLAKYQNILIERFRASLIQRGVRGFIGLRRQFRIIDINNNGALDFKEFEEAVKGFEIDVPDVDIRNAFKAFDLNQNGQVEYDEFAKVLIGPMNEYRTKLVEKAFDRIDVN